MMYCFLFFQKLEEKIDTMPDGEEKVKCQMILEHANVSSTRHPLMWLSLDFIFFCLQSMLDNIKHSIVLLQIAKVSVLV